MSDRPVEPAPMPEPPLSVRADPAEATPGSPCPVRVTVTNTGAGTRTVALAVVGLEPSWVQAADPTGPLAPGASAVTDIVVTLPLGHPASLLVASVVATDGDGGRATADLQLTVLDGSVVAAAVEPPEARGGRRGRAEVVLRNRGRVPIMVDLNPSSPDRQLEIRLAATTHVLDPGQEVRVRARLGGPRPAAGSPRRRPYAISIRSRGTPIFAEGTFVQRSLMPPWMIRGVAVAVVVALWVAAAVVGISHLDARVNHSAKVKAANDSPPLSTPAGPSGGSGSAGTGGAGTGGASGSGAGSGGNSGGGAGGGAASGSGGAADRPSRLSGKVAASTPGGVTVTVSPTSLTDAPAPAATVAAELAPGTVALAAAVTPLTKIYGGALDGAPAAAAPATQVQAMSTTTSPDGFYAFAGLTQPGYYLVSFSKAGYATADYVVDVKGDGQPISLPARLVPGPGSMSGTVSGPDGPLGGVEITITDGTVSLTTRTPTVGAVGTWSVRGLTTPDTYLVTARRPGYSIQTSLVTLGAGSSRSSVALVMTPGAGSVSGTVVSARSGQPVGGLSVTVSDASVSRTTTTTTVGAVGTYALPDLPVPGNYALTVSGPGYVTQTQEVSLSPAPGEDNVSVNATVTPSTAEVTGVARASGVGLAGAGAVLSNQQNTYKTLTTSGGTPGGFTFPQVPPGQYVLTIEKFGFSSVSAEVSVAPGQVKTVDETLDPISATSLATGTVQGAVESLATAKPVVGAVISLDGSATSTPTDSNGTFTLHNVAPGAHTVTAACPALNSCRSLDPGTGVVGTVAYESTSVQATLSLGGLAFAPTILMPQLDRLAGVVLDGSGARVPNPVVTLTNAETGISYTPVQPPTASGTTASQGGFEFDGLPHGNYTMIVKGPTSTGTGACAGVSPYQPLTTAVSLQPGVDVLLNGAAGTANASPVLTLLPVYRVQTDVYPVGGTGPVPTPGVAVTVSGVAGTASAGFQITCAGAAGSTETDVPLPVDLLGAPFTASFSYTDPSGVTYSAPTSAPFTAVYNNTTVDTALLVPPTSGVTIALSFPWRTPGGIVTCNASFSAVGTCPKLRASDEPTSVTVTVTTSRAGGGTGPTTVPATTVPGSGIWTIAPSALAGTVPGPATFNVTGGAFQAFTFATTTTDTGFSTQAFGLTPNTSAVLGTLQSPVAGTTVTVAPATSGLSVTTNPASTPNIVWQEAGQKTSQAFPGLYTVTFSAPGYDTAVLQDFSVPLCDGSCTDTLGTSGGPASTCADVLGGLVTTSLGTDTYTPGAGLDPTANLGRCPVVLTAHVTLQVTPVFTAQAGLTYPTVTVHNSVGAVVATVTLSATTTGATVPDLTATADPYSVTVAAPGFQTSVTSDSLPSGPLPSTVTDSPTLGAEGYFTGVVDGVIDTSPTPLGGVTLTASLTTSGTGCSAGASPAQLTGTSATNGTFVITNPSAGDGGVCPGSVYSVAVTAVPTGYTVPSATFAVTIGAGANAVNSGTPIDVAATQVPQTFTVTSGVGGPVIPGVVITGTSVIGRTVTGTTDTTGTAVMSPAPDPTTYQYTFTVAKYAPLTETISYHLGDPARTTTVALTLDQNTVKGTVTTPGSCGTSTVSPCPLAGVTLTLYDTNNVKIDSTTSAADGTYQFPTSPSVKIEDGSYLLQAALTGYQYSTSYQQSFATSPSLTTIHDVSLSPTPVNLTVTVSANLHGLDPTGDSVYLSPATPPAGLALNCFSSKGAVTATLAAYGFGTAQTSTVAPNGKASFAQVAPDFYDLTVKGTGLPQQASDGLVVCPGGTVAEYVPDTSTTNPASSASFEVLAGTLTGTAAVSSNSAITASMLSVQFTDTATKAVVDTVQVAANGSFTSDYLAVGTSYTAQALAPATSPGYDPSLASAAVTLSASNPPTGPVAIAGTLTVSPTPVQVTVTVTDSTNTSEAVANQTVTLADSNLTPATSYSATTDSSGSVTFKSVVPDDAKAYTISVGKLQVITGSSLQVSIDAGTVNQAVQVVYTGGISGTVTATSPLTVELCSDKACATVVASQATSAGYSFTGLDPGTYYVGASPATGSVSPSTPTAVTVTSATTASGPTLVYDGSLGGSVTGPSKDSVKVTLCSDSACATTVATQTVAGGSSYSFASLAPGTYWTEASTSTPSATVTPATISGPYTVGSGAPTAGQDYTVG